VAATGDIFESYFLKWEMRRLREKEREFWNLELFLACAQALRPFGFGSDGSSGSDGEFLATCASKLRFSPSNVLKDFKDRYRRVRGSP